MANETIADEPAFFTGYSNGLTKREYFAAKVLQGLLASGQYFTPDGAGIETAVAFADALIDGLNKPKP